MLAPIKELLVLDGARPWGDREGTLEGTQSDREGTQRDREGTWEGTRPLSLR